jgi:hypothetical protein
MGGGGALKRRQHILLLSFSFFIKLLLTPHSLPLYFLSIPYTRICHHVALEEADVTRKQGNVI